MGLLDPAGVTSPTLIPVGIRSRETRKDATPSERERQLSFCTWEYMTVRRRKR